MAIRGINPIINNGGQEGSDAPLQSVPAPQRGGNMDGTGQGVPPAPFPQGGDQRGTGNAASGSPQDLQSLIAQMLQMTGGGGTQNPFQPFYQQYPTQGQATMFQGAQLAPTMFAGAAQSGANTDLNPQFMQQLSPQSQIQQILTGFAPQANRSTRALNDQLAAAGVTGGAAVNAQDELQQQLAAGLAPSLAGAIQGSNQMQLQGNEFGVGNQLQQALQNAGYRQQAGLANAQFGNANNQLQGQFNQQTGLGNQNAQNAMTGQNLQNIMQNSLYNSQSANSAQQMYAQYLQNAYGMDYNAFQGLNNAGLAGQQGLAQTGLYGANGLAQSAANNFPVQSGAAAGFQNLGNNLGYYFNQQRQQQPPAISQPGAPAAPSAPYGSGSTGGYYPNPGSGNNSYVPPPNTGIP